MGRQILAKKQKESDEFQKIQGILRSSTKNLERKKEQAPEPLINEIEKFRNKFIRSENGFVVRTKSKDRSKQMKELIRHVFHKYNVPDFMFNAWSPKATNIIRQQFDFRQWYICLATGGSLYKEITKEFLTKKETHLFATCPHQINIEEALVYAIAKAEGAETGIALRIARSKIKDKNLNDYWKQNIRWFVTNIPQSISQINDLTDYLEAKKNENQNFTLMGSGFTLQSLLKKMHDWHYDLRRLKAIGEDHWQGHPIENAKYTYKDQFDIEYAWHFCQIKSSKELQEEGNAQRHCVLSYKSNCIKGNISIWSLRWGMVDDSIKQTKRKITLELRNDGSIVQARGLANRSMKSDEKAIVSRWAKDNALNMNSWL